MKTREKFCIAGMLAILIFTAIVETSLAGVRQAQVVNSNRTNIGTNAYEDMDTNPDAGYEYVNPNYSNQQTVYPGDGEQVSIHPRELSTDQNNLVADAYYESYGGPVGISVPVGALVESIPSSAIPVMVKGTRYYYDSSYNLFCTQIFDGGAILYQIVPPPLGAIISTLPAGCMHQYINGRSVSVCGNTIFQQVAGGYEVVAR